MIDALNRALTAYDDCPDDQDAHTLAAARFFEIAYSEVLGSQRSLVKRLTFGARSGCVSPELPEYGRPPSAIAEALLRAYTNEWSELAAWGRLMTERSEVPRKLVAHPMAGGTRARLLSDLLTPLTLHGAGSHADSPTGRTTRREPELQRLPWNTPKRSGPVPREVFEVDYAKLECDFVEMYGMYECKLAPVFDDIPATHEIVDPKPREWSGPDEPARVNFRVSAATLLSLGGGS